MPNPTIQKLTREQCCDLYAQALADNDAQTMRRLCLEDLFFLLVVGTKRVDLNRQWLFERIREVESDPDEHLDLWFRGAGKSSIITFGKTIQDILVNPEETVGIFSHTRPIAKAFLAQIKREFETNTFLQGLFPDVLWSNPHKEAPKWSLDDGIIVKRKGNPKESTVEAWGLVDGMPTSKHYSLMIYDDVVTKDSVTSPEMSAKVTESFSLSLNLSAERCRKRFIGTRYHSLDTYASIMERGTATPRVYKATKDGTLNGEPVLWTREEMQKKIADMDVYVASAQLLQDPFFDKAMGFKKDWLLFYSVLRKTSAWNFYILVDPANEKKRGSDYTVILVIGLAPDGNYYLVDGLRDRLNLTERTSRLFNFVRIWKPINTGYEKYGLQSDIEHIKYVQEQEGYRFRVTALGGQQPKNDRIRRLVPVFEQGRMYFPHTLNFVTAEGKLCDLVREIIEKEYLSFPVSTHDDALDALSRILDDDLQAVFPKVSEVIPVSMAGKDEPHDVLSRNVSSMYSDSGVIAPSIKEPNTWKSLLVNQ